MDIKIEINNNEITSSKCGKKSRKNHNVISSKLRLDTLNMECFLNILDHLDSQTLMNLSHVNEQFRANVFAYESIFKSKLFEIAEFVDLIPIFREYGRFICKLDVNEYNILRERFSMKFDRLMESIVEYIVPGNLTELTLRFGIVKSDNGLFARAVPYFCNLKRFTFSGCSSDNFSRAQEHVLDEIIGNAHQLTSLDVRYVRTAGNWYRFSHLKQLNHLTFLFVELTAFAPFRQFIQNRPTLKTLILSTESVHHQHICRLVTRYIPQLREFEFRNTYMQLPHGDDFDFSPIPWIRKEAEQENDTTNEDDDDGGWVDDENEDGDDDDENDLSFEGSGGESEFETEESDSDIDDVRDPEFNADHDPLTKWNEVFAGLNEMNNLRKTWLKSHFTDCSDLYSTVTMLAEKNLVYHLTIQISTSEYDLFENNHFLVEPFPHQFTSLQTLRLISPTIHTQPFLHNFLQSMPNMTKIILDHENIDRSAQDTIATIVQAANNLEIIGLKMPAMNLDHLLYMKLIGIKFSKNKTLNQNKPLHIYINSYPQRAKCIAELKDYYDENIIAIKIKSFMTWESDPL